ncbi:MAG: thioredoxin, partial [Acidimicrobiia bacterium]|nr:thioredoxin [Acidimicrobiia bacterium]
MRLPDGFVAVVKKDCPTCHLVIPALSQILDGPGLTVVTQDDPSWPPGFSPVDDTDLVVSWELQTETTPTLYRVEGGTVTESVAGWSRREWESVTGLADLAPELPEHRPGCGSLIFEPLVHERLQRAANGRRTRSRTVELGSAEDEHEAMAARGWTDGLPVVPPTPERVERMLTGTTRDPGEVVCVLAPDLVPCTVEKVAINAVMAGCLPEFLPVVLASVEAVATDRFNIHGVSATTFFVGPVIVVNGPIRERIGMNSGMNALGPGNRANSTIGRALNLVVRNVGGAKPGGVDRATLGSPAKIGLCFPEAEEGSPWESL